MYICTPVLFIAARVLLYTTPKSQEYNIYITQGGGGYDTQDSVTFICFLSVLLVTCSERHLNSRTKQKCSLCMHYVMCDMCTFRSHFVSFFFQQH